MKKYIFYIFIFFCFNKVLAQSSYTKITYKNILNFGLEVTSDAELFFNNSKSFYVEKNEELQTTSDKLKKYRIFSEDDIYYIDFQKDSLIKKTYLQEKLILACEELPKFAWKIEKTKDSILGYSCNKATAKFRGRQYTVWFTENIPVRFGPWKFNGLPGLILKVKDNLQQVIFLATKIEHVKPEDYNFDFKKGKKVSLKQYVKMLNDDLKEKSLKIFSKFPRGTAKNLKFKEFRGIELKYEWED